MVRPLVSHVLLKINCVSQPYLICTKPSLELGYDVFFIYKNHNIASLELEGHKPLLYKVAV